MSSTRMKNVTVRGGVYYFQMRYKGERYSKSLDIPVRGRAEAQLAEKKAHEVALTVYDGTYDKVEVETAPSMTVGAWCDKHVSAQKGHVTLHTYLNLQNTSRLLRETVVNGETWEEKNLRDITETDCRALQTALRFSIHKSQNTRRTFHSISQSIFERAVKEKLLDANPWDFAKPAAVPRDRVVSLAEEKAIRPHLAPYFQRVMTLELFSGLRVGCELVKLKLADIDFQRRQVTVRKGKGGKSRLVPLSAESMTALREQMAQNATGNPGTEKPSAKMLKRLEDGYLFPVTPRMVLRAWHLAARAAGIDLFTSHDLRRTYGTRCAEAGVPMKRLQVWMGHSDISITAKFYVHLGNEGDAALLDRMSAAQKEADAAAGVTSEATSVLQFTAK